MNIARKFAQDVGACVCVGCFFCVPSQSQTSGRIVGQVSDIGGAVIVGASVTVESVATGERRSTVSDPSGAFSISYLPQAEYVVAIAAPSFAIATYNHVMVAGTATTTLNVKLDVAPADIHVEVNEAPPLLQTSRAELATTLSAMLTSMPVSTRNFLQLAAFAPGVSMPLTDNRAVGRNTPNFSVNGARFSQNSLTINGVDSTDNAAHDLGAVAIPAPETISEVIVQTSMYDVSITGAGGGSVQVTTQSGTNLLHRSVYEYFRNDGLNANDPDLKAVRTATPVLRRNVFGATLGGPIRKNRAFFFLSYQGTRETNGATDQSLYKDVLIAPGLTDDRSEATLLNTFHPLLPDLMQAKAIDPVSLRLLNSKLPNGQWLIPTPQRDGRVTGTIPSTYYEDQFNTNFDFQFGARNSLAAKLFFANAPQLAPLVGAAFGGANLPGFGMQIQNDNRVLSLAYVHLFSPNTINEARFGYNFIRNNQFAQEPIHDSDLGIQRTTAANFPGLPLILLARDAQGASIGSPSVSLPGNSLTYSLGDMLSWQHGKHSLRFGGQVIFRRWTVTGNINSYGEIDFPTFNDFLTGSSDFSVISSGLTDVDFRTVDYNAFVQDDWKLSPKLTLNLGLRYELDLPGYERQGRMSSFDPALYRPRMEIDESGAPVGPPIAGFVLPGNVAAQYDVAGLPKVSNSLLKSVDPNNLAPRVGISWSPLSSGHLLLGGGYGIFNSRPSFLGLGYGVLGPPFYTTAVSPGQSFANPFPTVVPQNLYPVIQPGIMLAGNYLDRNNRTPYIQQFNASVQYEFTRDTTLQAAYVGTRGVRLYRFVGVNQAQIASLTRPVVNAVTGEVITTNTNANAQLRAPMQGVWTNSFLLNRTDAQSTYHSLQVSVNRSISHGLQFEAAYTFSKSIDDASGAGGGSGSEGLIDRSSAFDTGVILGNQLDPRSNRGVSDFDRPQHFVAAFTWDLPQPHFVTHSRTLTSLLTNWQASGIATLMSGLPIDIVDPSGGALYGLNGARPNWAPGANRQVAMNNVPQGYYFNPYAFATAVVQPGQPIPSAHDPNALAGDVGTDVGNVGRNALRGPDQSCLDFSLLKRWPIRESSSVEFRADFFNLFNHANYNNPVSDISTVLATGGSIDPVTRRILSPGDFGRILNVSSSPRIIQFALKVAF